MSDLSREQYFKFYVVKNNYKANNCMTITQVKNRIFSETLKSPEGNLFNLEVNIFMSLTTIISLFFLIVFLLVFASQNNIV